MRVNPRRGISYPKSRRISANATLPEGQWLGNADYRHDQRDPIVPNPLTTSPQRKPQIRIAIHRIKKSTLTILHILRGVSACGYCRPGRQLNQPDAWVIRNDSVSTECIKSSAISHPCSARLASTRARKSSMCPVQGGNAIVTTLALPIRIRGCPRSIKDCKSAVCCVPCDATPDRVDRREIQQRQKPIETISAGKRPLRQRPWRRGHPVAERGNSLIPTAIAPELRSTFQPAQGPRHVWRKPSAHRGQR